MTSNAVVPVVAPESAGRQAQKLTALGKICIVALMIPAYFKIGTLLMTPSRIVFLIVIPILLVRLFSNRYGRVNSVDWLFLFHIFWFTLSATVNQPNVVVTFAGSTTVIMLGGYLAGRAAVRNLEQFLGFVRFFALVVTIGLPFALYEALSHHLSVALWIEMIPGVTSNKDVQYPLRMGLDRVQWVFVHPIHFGFFCSLSVGLFFVAMRNQMGTFRLWAQTGVLALMTFLSLSSGPFLAMIIQFMLILWAYVMRGIKRPWMTLVWLATGLYVVLEVASNGPVLYYIIAKVAFNPATANVRRILLDYGIAQVMADARFRHLQAPLEPAALDDGKPRQLLAWPRGVIRFSDVLRAFHGLPRRDREGNPSRFSKWKHNRPCAYRLDDVDAQRDADTRHGVHLERNLLIHVLLLWRRHVDARCRSPGQQEHRTAARGQATKTELHAIRDRARPRPHTF